MEILLFCAIGAVIRHMILSPKLHAQLRINAGATNNNRKGGFVANMTAVGEVKLRVDVVLAERGDAAGVGVAVVGDGAEEGGLLVLFSVFKG